MRALYDPPFLFELSSTCLTVHKKDSNQGYQKYRMLSLSDAQRYYPDVCKLLLTDKPKEESESEPQIVRGLENLSLMQPVT